MTDEEKKELKEFSGRFFVFNTTHLTLKAEKLLKEEGIPNRLFPKPRSVRSECGLILKVIEKDFGAAESLFAGKGLPVKEVIDLSPEEGI